MASYSPAARQILDLLHDRVVAFHPALVPLLGGPDEALLVSQLLFWDGKGSAPARWIYKTQEAWEREIGLSPHRQRRARRHLQQLGVLEERLGGMPARLYYRLDLAALAALAGAGAPAEPVPDAPTPDAAQRPDQDRDTAPELVTDTYPELDLQDPADLIAATSTAISENTAQITMPDGTGPGPDALAELWRRVCRNLRPALVAGCFRAYIEPCVLLGLGATGGRVRAYVEVPSELERDWLAHRMRIVLPRALSEELGCDVEVTYCLPGEGPPATAPGSSTTVELDLVPGTLHDPPSPETSPSLDDTGLDDVSASTAYPDAPVGAGLCARPLPTDAAAPPSARPHQTSRRASDPPVGAGLCARPLPTDAPAPPSAGPPQTSHPVPDAPVGAGGGRHGRHRPARPRVSGRSSRVPATAAAGPRRRAAEPAPPGRPRRARRR